MLPGIELIQILDAVVSMNVSHKGPDCLSQNQLRQFLDSTVDLDSQSTTHLSTCQDCQTRLDALIDTDGLEAYQEAAGSKKFQEAYFGNEPSLQDDDFVSSFGRYRIESPIGRGGMGTVYRARDEELDRMVAIKVLTGEANQRSTARFDRESRAAAGLRHDHLVPVHSVGRTTDGRPYLVMPLVLGQTLKQHLANGPLDPIEAATFICQIAKGLAVVHENELVHRDVKPANILLDSDDGRAKLTDFGLARAEVDTTLTQANMVCGTPEYMSPEQAGGSTDPQPASDIYSLGVTLYECLTGTTPFRGSPIQILDQHRQAEPVAPSRLNAETPRDLETICLKAICKEPNRRYLTATELADDLERFIDGRPILAKPV